MFRVLAISIPVLLVFAATVLVAALGLAWLGNPELGSPDTFGPATVCGLIAWLFFAVFHVKHETLTLPVQDQHAFLVRLRAQLKDLGYDARRSEGERQVFRPAFHALLFGGKIRVRVEAGEAHVSGPKLSLENLRKRLRVQSHLANDLKTFWHAKRRNKGRQPHSPISLADSGLPSDPAKPQATATGRP
jgi:hypothetical protein